MTTEPKDYYGEALALCIRRQTPEPEMAAAIMAQIAEAMVDTIAAVDGLPPDGTKIKITIENFLADLKRRRDL